MKPIERSITVHMEVVGKARPKVTFTGAGVMAYTPKKTVEAEALIKQEWITRHGRNSQFKGAVAVTIVTERRLPASRPNRVQVEDDTFKPDVDNVAKLVLDALNKVAYEDDKQVTELTVQKLPRRRKDFEGIHITVEGKIGD